VLRHLSNSVGLCASNASARNLHLYTFTTSQTCSAARAKLFGSPLAASFHDSSRLIATLGGEATATRWVILIVVLISAAATLATQLLTRANAVEVATGTAAAVQRVMLYGIPLSVIASGLLFNFPLGVLIYWLVGNVWSLGQQAYIIRFHPPEPVTITV
jgi:YidC/Oxa1 family membrane protein insertase